MNQNSRWPKRRLRIESKDALWLGGAVLSEAKSSNQDNSIRSGNAIEAIAKRECRLKAGAGYIKKSSGVLCQCNALKYAWIKAHSDEYYIALMCSCLEVNRSSYYEWCRLGSSSRTKADLQVSEQIKIVFEQSRRNYGTRRIKHALAKQQMTISRRRIGSLMKQASLRCKVKRRFKATTESKHAHPVAPNLLNRQFTTSRPDPIYVGDITYIHTQSGWLYLAVVIDLFSRKVVGWSMAEHMKTELVNHALLMAIWRRKPARGLIWHTDRGSQYASESHRKLLQQHGIRQSKSRKGNCRDNAVAESFFHTLKTELVYQTKFNVKVEAQQAIFEFIEVFYNQLRLHSANDYLSPADFEMAQNF